MTPVRRTIKRLSIIIIYLIIFSLIGAGLYFLSRTAPTCRDLTKNQRETGIDCGGPCAPCEEIPKAEKLEITEKAIIPAGAGRYDALVKIVNPNSQLGVAKFDYSFNVIGEAGKIAAQNAGSGFLLPGQSKYVMAFNLAPETEPIGFNFEISSFEWSKFSEYEEPDIAVYAREFSLTGGGESGFAKLKAKMKNQSGYDFRRIEAYAVVRDGSGAPVAINGTDFDDIRAGEEREVNFNWNSPFSIDPLSAKIEIVPEVNVFESDNFMKEHGVPGQYGTYGASNQQ